VYFVAECMIAQMHESIFELKLIDDGLIIQIINKY
jgi:hypothetical protein